MKSLQEIKEIIGKEKPHLSQKYGVSEIGIFGSFVRGEAKGKSDLDVLVSFDEPIGLIDFMKLEYYLSDMLGVKVELVMKSALKPRIGKNILREVVML